MLALGLGKQRGAELYHREMTERGYPSVISQVAERVLASGKLLFGVGVVENAYAQTAQIAVLPPEGLAEAEAALLRRAKALAASLPFDEIDLLVIDEIGKDVSGAGFDPKIVGRPPIDDSPVGPRVKRLALRDLTEATKGNATGIGDADFVTQRLVEKIDRDARVPIEKIHALFAEITEVTVTDAAENARTVVPFGLAQLSPAALAAKIREG